MAKMRAAQVARPKGPFEIVEREIPEPGAGAVRIKVQACGVCHSDVLTKEGLCPASNIRAFRAMRWSASLTPSARA